MLKKNFHSFEIAIVVDKLNHLHHKPTIGQIRTEYEKSIKQIQELAEDSDPDITDELLTTLIVKPNFDDLTIESINIADFDSHFPQGPRIRNSQPERYIVYWYIITYFTFETQNIDYDNLSYSPF